MSKVILDELVEREELYQTKSLMHLYADYFESDSSLKSFIQDIADLYEAILSDHGQNITPSQQHSLTKIFNEFVSIQLIIDPNRLKEFKYSLAQDGELLLYRRTQHGLSNVIIDDEDSVSFSFIPFDSSEKSVLEHFVDGDLQKAAFLLFSR